MRITLYTIVTIIISTMLLGVVSCEHNNVTTTESASPIGAYASWDKAYTNLNDMVTASQLIAIGVVTRVKQTVQESEDFLYATYFEFQIEKVLKGKEIGEIVIYQTGISDKPWTVIVDNPLFQVGEKYFLFLDNNTPGIFVSMGGPAGRYKVLNNKVYSMNNVLQNNEYTAPEALNFNGVELTSFITTITETLDMVRILSSPTARLLSGETGKIEIILATGKYGEGRVSYKINRVDSKEGGNQIPLPDGMEVIIEPTEFMASPYNDYRSVIEIRTNEQVIVPGEYWILIEFNIGGTTSGQYVLRVVIDKKKLSEIETRPQ